MINQIGETAGMVWTYLDMTGETTITNLKKELNLKGDQTALSLGWLAREEKISFKKKGAGIKVKALK